MNIFYLHRDGAWSRDSQGATLLFQADYDKYFVLHSGAWSEVNKDTLTPLQQGLFWYTESKGELIAFYGILSLNKIDERLLSGLEPKDSQGLKAGREDLGNNFYLAKGEAKIFIERGESKGAVFQQKPKTRQEKYLPRIDSLLEEDLRFLQSIKKGDISDRPAFTERGKEIRDLAERAMRSGEDLGNRLLLRSQIETRAEDAFRARQEDDTEFLILLELLEDALDNATMDEEGLWLHFPESDIFLGKNRSIFLRGK